MTELTIPFNYLPDFSFNPYNYAELFYTEPFNEKLEEIGYGTKSFIYNLYENLLTWVVMGICYLILNKLCSIIPRTRYS